MNASRSGADHRDDRRGAEETDDASLDQPEDEATEHALRLMNEALRRDDAGRRWLITGDS